MSARSRRTASSTGQEGEPGQLVFGDTQAGEIGQGAAVEDEHELVVPRPVRPVPVQHEQSTDKSARPSSSRNFRAAAARGGSLASAIPPGRSQKSL